MATGTAEDLTALLAGYPPFDSLPPEALEAVAAAASIGRFARGELVYDAFTGPTAEVFLVIAGRVELWNDADALGGPADQVLGPGGLFGFSSMLTERAVGPRAVAAGDAAVAPAFASRTGARFLAEQVSSAGRPAAAAPAYSTVDDLIVRPPVVVDPTTTVAETARLMSDADLGYAAVRDQRGGYGLITDALLRQRVLVEGRSDATPVGEVMDPGTPAAVLGDSAAEALILMLDREADYLLVTDRAGVLRGVVSPRDFAVSPTTAGASVHEQLRRATTVEQLEVRARTVPGVLADLLDRGLASARVVAVHSALVDAVVRRALTLVVGQHPDLSVDAFTWLSLGSHGRREAVLSSDVDSAVAFDDATDPAQLERYRAAFAEVGRVLARAGINEDEHGANAERPPFARTNTAWRQAAQAWLARPAEDQGAVMTSLLVDARPIHGDPGLPAAAAVFSDLRRHPGTMRLLLQESLSRRARQPPARLLSRRSGRFDVKDHAVLPIVNLARWAGLSVGSAALSTPDRLRAASGSAMLPQEQGNTLVEVYEVLQRLRLRYQVRQHQLGVRPTDVLRMDQVSPLDRSVIAQAVREVASVQRRMDNVAQYVPVEAWASPPPP
jgi:CBS domain-containing protein